MLSSLLLQHTALLHLSYSYAPPTHAALVTHRHKATWIARRTKCELQRVAKVNIPPPKSG
jgi:hypothetical protein